MKQKEKIDLIIQWLYERRHDNPQPVELRGIMKELGIFESEPELRLIADRLTSEKCVELERISSLYTSVKVTNIFNKEVYNAVIGNHNSSFQQTAIINKKAQELVGRVKEGIKSSPKIDEKQKAELLEFVEEINEKIQAQKTVSSFSWSMLLSNTANLAQVVEPALQLAKLCGFIP